MPYAMSSLILATMIEQNFSTRVKQFTTKNGNLYILLHISWFERTYRYHSNIDIYCGFITFVLTNIWPCSHPGVIQFSRMWHSTLKIIWQGKKGFGHPFCRYVLHRNVKFHFYTGCSTDYQFSGRIHTLHRLSWDWNRTKI